MSRFSLRTKLIVTLSIVLFSAFFATNIINYNVSKHSLHAGLIEDALPIVSNNVYSEIQKDLMRPIQVSSLMANDTFVKDWLINGEKEIEKIQKYLQEIKDKYNFVSTFLVSAKTLKYYHFNGVHKVISPDDTHDVWYYNFLKTGLDMQLDVDTDQADNNNLTIFINHRLMDSDGNLLGVTGVGLSMSKIGTLLKTYEGIFKRNIYLVDKTGLIQIHSDPSIIETVNIFDKAELKPFKDSILDAKTAPKTFEYDSGNKHILLISRYISELDWYLMVEQDDSLPFKAIRKNLIRNLIFGFLISCIIILINIVTVNYYQNRLEIMATTDPLTGIPNRNLYWDKARSEFVRSRRYQNPLSVLMIDLDYFKQLNDTHGHLAGDKVLKEVAKECLKNLREYDVFARLGGEEFSVILPETEQEKGLIVAERLREAIENLKVSSGSKTIQVTISIGLAQMSHKDKTFEEILLRSDNALYAAKRNGRNRVMRG